MFIRSSLKPLFVAFSALLIAGFMPIFAQDPKEPVAAAKPADEKKVFDPARRVPPYFGQIGLTPEQREAIYKIRSKHADKIEELHKQIVMIQSEMMAECESQLNETQKKLLEFRRTSAAKLKKTPAETPAPATTPTVEKAEEKASDNESN